MPGVARLFSHGPTLSKASKIILLACFLKVSVNEAYVRCFTLILVFMGQQKVDTGAQKLFGGLQIGHACNILLDNCFKNKIYFFKVKK